LEASTPPASEGNSAQGDSARLIAFAYLNRQGDARNLLQLTDGALHITYRGRHRAFSLAYVQQLALEHRKLWLPLIGGGILASLCLLALLQTFSMPLRLLSGVMAGFLLMWWGLRGSGALVVYEQRNRTDFLLPVENKSLPLFVAFTNRLIRRYPAPLGHYCFLASEQEVQQLQGRGALQLEEPRLCQPRDSLRALPPIGVTPSGEAPQGRGYWLVLDPLRLGSRLHWSLRGQELQAHVQGRLVKQEIEEFLPA
jgi:hypothetical protein